MKKLSLHARSRSPPRSSSPPSRSGLGRRRRSTPHRRHRHDLIKGSKKAPLKFVSPKTVISGEELKSSTNRSRNKSARTPSRWSQGSLPKTKTARKKCFTPNHICMAIAEWHGVQPKTEKITINPAKAGRRLGHEGTLSKKGDSWFTGEKKGTSFTQQVTAAAGHHDLLHVRHPPLDARLDRSPARRASGTSSPPSSSPAWGAELPRRPGRRRARAPAAPAGARPAGCCRSGPRPPRGAARGAVPGPAADPAGADATPRSRSRCARPRSRSCPARKTRMWTYGGTFPGPTIRRPAGRAHRGHLPARAAGRGGRAHRPPARRPQPQRVRRPAGRPDPVAAALLLLPDPAAASRRASRATTC